jgi:hypothetical protein
MDESARAFRGDESEFKYPFQASLGTVDPALGSGRPNLGSGIDSLVYELGQR